MKTTLHKIMRQAALITALAAPWLTADAVRARMEPVEAVQPDGTALTYMLHGDEHFHYCTTTDGYILVEADGALQYASADLRPSGILAHDASVRTTAETRFLDSLDTVQLKHALAQHANAVGQSSPLGRKAAHQGLFEGASFPCTGSPKVLVVLVEYSDVPFKFAQPLDYFTRLLNEEGFDEFGATGSAYDFFRDSSCGRFTPQFDVYGPVKLPQTRNYYGSNAITGQDRAPWEMAIDACTILDDEIDFNDYDADGDGMIDNVFIFYAGRGEATGGGPHTVWPHSADINNLIQDRIYFDGVELNRYACTNEWNRSTVRGARPDGIGTFVHEFSHVMGLPDLYATDYSTAFTPGKFSTLDYGPYLNDGCTPPLYSAFERYAVNWLEPTLLAAEGDMTLRPIGDNEAGIIYTENDNEFFLFENRQNTGWDTYLPGHGMMVWHVDYVADIWNRNCVNNLASHQYVDLIEADAFPTEDTKSGDPFPGAAGITRFDATTTPALWSWHRKPTAVGLSMIEETPDGMITFRLTDGQKGMQNGLDTLTATAAEKVYNACGLCIGTLSEGQSLQSLTDAPGIYVLKSAKGIRKVIMK